MSAIKPWCCQHRLLLWYIAIVVTLLLVSAMLEIRGIW